MILVLSSSLAADSNSRLLARESLRVLEQDGHSATFVDLRDYPLPFCGSPGAYQDARLQPIATLLRSADAIIIATPIYNYDATAALKNLIELTGDAWESKVVGFLCAAGGMSSYMSIMALANSLMLDFRSVIVPRFVYATGEQFADDKISDEGIRTRIADLSKMAARLSGAMKTLSLSA